MEMKVAGDPLWDFTHPLGFANPTFGAADLRT
jgi:hypothetical protein